MTAWIIHYPFHMGIYSIRFQTLVWKINAFLSEHNTNICCQSSWKDQFWGTIFTIQWGKKVSLCFLKVFVHPPCWFMWGTWGKRSLEKNGSLSVVHPSFPPSLLKCHFAIGPQGLLVRLREPWRSMGKREGDPQVASYKDNSGFQHLKVNCW